MSLVRLPRARSPSVEKKSSISFSRRRLRFSASSRARSEFLSLISSIRFLFLSCSISCSSLSICAHIAELDSSSLQRAEHRCVSGQYRYHNTQLLMKEILDGILSRAFQSFSSFIKITCFRKSRQRGVTIMYGMWKIMCFLNLESRKHIALHQIHKIM